MDRAVPYHIRKGADTTTQLYEVRGRVKQILFVDDESMLLSGLKRMLQPMKQE
ncbi:MAG: hypothetical protein OEY86_20215 [Nitrospira sp.]|nr:hypothetical protein [Nitrospira sp.]